MEYTSKSEKETYKIAANLAEKAEPGDVFALKGDLGSGKTTFVKGFALALGVKQEITSPTFVVLKKYPLAKNKQNIRNLIHIDCYRLASFADAESVGLLEYLNENDNIILAEWPENVSNVFDGYNIKTISFYYKNEKTRLIRIEE